MAKMSTPDVMKRSMTRWRLLNMVTGQMIEISAPDFVRACSWSGWHKDNCIGVPVGKSKAFTPIKVYAPGNPLILQKKG